MILDEKNPTCPNDLCAASPSDDNQENMKAIRKMRCLDLGNQVARMLCNPNLEKLMQYPVDTFKYDEHAYTDYFSGKAFQALSKSELCKGSDFIIYLGLFIDAFVNSNVSKNSHFTIFHILNFNMPPSIRYIILYQLNETHFNI
jgi:hypothetical protein